MLSVRELTILLQLATYTLSTVEGHNIVLRRFEDLQSYFSRGIESLLQLVYYSHTSVGGLFSLVTYSPTLVVDI